MTVFPSLTVNIGFIAISASSGTGPFLTFNDATWGKFGTGEFAPDLEWANVTADVRSITTSRGRQRQIEAFPAGTCTIVLDNTAGNYDPDNPNSIYFSGSTDVLPMRPVQIVANWNGVSYPIFFGYVDQINPQYAPGKYSDAWTTITASDAMKIFQNIPTTGSAGSELSGNRVNRILNNANWPASLQTLAPGDCFLQGTIFSSTVAQDIQLSADSEFGRWYIGPAGDVIFENRSFRNRVQTPISTWTDSNTAGNMYSDVSRVMDDDLIRNRVSIQNVGGTAQVKIDVPSITQYQSRSYSASNLLLTTDADAYELADVILYVGKSLTNCRFDNITFEPMGDPTNLWPEVLSRQISNRIDVVVTPPYVTPMTLGMYIEGVSHTIVAQPEQSWTVSFNGSPQAHTKFLQFNDATFGIIGTDTFGY